MSHYGSIGRFTDRLLISKEPSVSAPPWAGWASLILYSQQEFIIINWCESLLVSINIVQTHLLAVFVNT